MSSMNFGYHGNGLACTCGRHEGVGDWSAERRAAVYARQREKLTSLMQPHMWEFLESWEQTHGAVQYEMQQVGVYSRGHERAGQPLMGPVFTGGYTPKQRKDTRIYA